MGLDHPIHDEPLATRLAPSEPQRGVRRYAVKSLWRTLQGEGAWAGRAAVFVRFVGCNMWTGYDRDRERDAARGHACAAFCDTDFTKEGSVRLTASALADEAARVAAGEGGAPPVDLIVLTGGEPLLQADAALVQALHEQGLEVAVETNGTVRLADAFGEPEDWPDWVVCSPKLPADQTVIEALDELKLVVPAYRPADYAAVADRVRPHRVGTRQRRYLWVQPEDGPRLDQAQRLAVSLAQADPRWRVSTQTHKLLHVD
ncbi:MAG: 7-carboxy-7-deazaguanine synthase [Sandaracinaceae bacterium]